MDFTTKYLMRDIKKTFSAWMEERGQHIECRKRNKELERLCIDLYRDKVDAEAVEFCPTYKAFHDRMKQLGLIHETEYDPDTGLKWGEQ